MENNETNVPRIIAMANMKGGAAQPVGPDRRRGGREQPGGARHHTRPSRPRPYVGDG